MPCHHLFSIHIFQTCKQFSFVQHVSDIIQSRFLTLRRITPNHSQTNIILPLPLHEVTWVKYEAKQSFNTLIWHILVFSISMKHSFPQHNSFHSQGNGFKTFNRTTYHQGVHAFFFVMNRLMKWKEENLRKHKFPNRPDQKWKITIFCVAMKVLPMSDFTASVENAKTQSQTCFSSHFPVELSCWRLFRIQSRMCATCTNIEQRTDVISPITPHPRFVENLFSYIEVPLRPCRLTLFLITINFTESEPLPDTHSHFRPPVTWTWTLE